MRAIGRRDRLRSTRGRDPRWRRVDDIFGAALEFDPGPQRDAYLDEVCGGDPALRQELESLLASDAQAEDFLAASAVVPPSSDAERPSADPQLRRDAPLFPRYRLLRSLSQGVMASVYLACRTDSARGQLVVLKVMRAGDVAEGVRRRFEQEQRILARLHHPGIASLYDAGVVDDRPYLVLEYVEGLPIDLYCQRHELPVADRLRLFTLVCAAMEHAHLHLLVHRDVKPDNVLVTPDGTPKLLDFGIAKALVTGNFAGDEVAATGLGVRPMTLRYASPEQVRGDSISLATDVYSLGVLLYELLTGHSPYRWSGGALYELEQEICEGEPQAPSRRVGPRAAATLRGDLDSIVLTAVAKQPAQRYPTVERLAADVRNYLQGRPVDVRSPSFGYRLGKLVRRHRLAVVAAVAALAVLITFIGGLLVHNHRIRQQRAEAEVARDAAARARAEAEAALAFMMDSFRLANPTQRRGREITVRQLLDAGAGRVAEVFTDRPRVQASLYDSFGRVYADMGEVARATALLEQAVELRQRVLAADDPELVDSRIALTLQLIRMGRYADAETLGQQTQRRWEQRGETETLGVEERIQRMQNALYLALAFHRQQRDDEAETHARRALAWAGDHPSASQALSLLGSILGDQGRFAAAEAALEEATEIVGRVLAPEHPLQVQNWVRRARVHSQAGHPERALDQLERALSVAHEHLAPDHPLVARVLWERGYAERAAGLRERAVASWREGLALSAARLRADHPLLIARRDELAALLRALGRAQEATALLRTPAEPAEAATDGRLGSADLLLDVGALAEQTDRRWRILEQRREQLPAGHREIAEAEVDLGVQLRRQGRYAEAEPLLLAGQARLAELLAPGHPSRVAGLEALVELYRRWGREHEASVYAERLAASPRAP